MSREERMSAGENMASEAKVRCGRELGGGGGECLYPSIDSGNLHLREQNDP